MAVIGAGFSGLLTTLHLLADPDGPTVRLVERRGVFGRGLAYSAANADQILNVRVGNMSAFPDQPMHFVDWLAGRGGWSAQGGFVTRGVYGDYLQSLLREAVGAFGADRLLLEADEAVRLRRAGSGWRIATAMGRGFSADAAVLAIGALPPAPPASAEEDLLASGRYFGDPWRAAGAACGRHVLLVGTGLTMVDVALSLAGSGRRLTAISRRGLLPRVHGGPVMAPPREDIVGTPLEILRQARRRAVTHPWREVSDELRGAAQSLWTSWPAPERRRFLRHLRPWWDVHRHRMAPSVARRIDELRRTGELKVHAGGVERLALRSGHVAVDWRPRGGRRVWTQRADTIVNCTGFQGDLSAAADPLIRDLLSQQLLRPDPCALGIDVDLRARPLNRWGSPTTGLYAVGPLTRGAFWEITSVPDIRVEAARIATVILQDMALAAA